MDFPASPQTLARALVGWFDEHRRDLPWRKDRSAYRVWLSEVMLQQTRVAVVVDYFRRFVARFPDVRALAAASEDDVLSLWSGLGYYSRGRNVHAAAKAVVAGGGAFPSSADALRALPGVGPYTANAVASLAFGEKTAVVDGNVMRVLARLCADSRAIDKPATKASMQARAQSLVEAWPQSAPVNEGLMELGALVCTPKTPSCDACPWRTHCGAYKDGAVSAYPVKAAKKARKAMHVASVVVVDERGHVWLEKRPSRGLFGGLFEPPSSVCSDDPDDVRATWRALLRDRALRVPRRMPKPIVVQRTLTHRDLRFSIARVDVAGVDGPFVDVDVAAGGAGVGVSSAVRAVLDVTLGQRGG